MKPTNALILAWTLSILTMVGLGLSTPVKVCVTAKLRELCEQMEQELTETWKCVVARDKLDCAQKMMTGEADVTNMDERSLYISGRYFDGVPIATEVIDGQTHRYAGIALVSKSSNISTPNHLRGRRSCHTGVGRTVGWQLPIGMLLSSGEMTLDCTSNDLDAVQEFFAGGSCAPGNWSSDPLIDKELKNRYIGLCSRCKESCQGDDVYAGYEGAVRCLVDGSGDVAFTKIPVMRDMLSKDPSLADKLEILCFEGERQPLSLDGEVCTWGYRPSNAYVTTSENKASNLERLLEAIDSTQARYPPPHVRTPEWYHKVFLSGAKVDSVQRVTPDKSDFRSYLGNFINVIEKPRRRCEDVNDDRPVKFCVTSEPEMSKCRDYGRAASSRALYPTIDCVQAVSKAACMQTVKDGNADLLVLDGGYVYKAGRYFDMQPVSAEIYGDMDASYYGVAVIRSASDVTKLSQLRGLRSCHTGMGRTAGWIVPIGALLQDGDIPEHECDRPKAVAEFFTSGSCIPGANDTKYNPGRSHADILCRHCIGDEEGKNKCASDSRERFSGYAGAFRCLAEGGGEVAFVKHTTVPQYTDGRGTEALWSRDLLSSDFQLLCGKGGNANVEQFRKCNLAKVPSHYVMTGGNVSRDRRLVLATLLADSSRYFGDDSDLFRLLDKYGVQEADLLFKDSSTSLRAAPLSSSYRDVLGEDFYRAAQAVDAKACAK